MELLNLAALGLMAVALLVLVVALAAAIGRNLKVGRVVRERLARRVAELPLAKMLKLVGVDTGHYLHGEYLKDVRQQIDTCQSCEQSQHCVDTLDPVQSKVEDYAFCPNQESLQRLRSEMDAAAAREQAASGQVSATRS